MSHTPTAEQAAIIDSFEFGSDLVVQAGAGTGKTSTLKMLAAATSQRGVYIAYNRAIAADAERSFPRTVTCKTAHGLAYGAVGKRFARRLNGPRLPAQRQAQILGISEPVKVGPLTLSPQQLARLAGETITRWCYSADDQVGRLHVPLVPGLDRHGQRELAGYLVPVAQRAWDEDLSRVDGLLRYQHDHYLKAWILTRPQLPCDYVLLDEAQDSNGAVAGLVSGQNAQKILVGDQSQAIYGWRGATDAMEHAPGKRLTLSQSFRFGPAIADEANKWLSILVASLRLRGYDRVESALYPLDTPDAVLCRSNAGAVTEVIAALTAGRKPALVGGGQEIRALAEAARDLRSGRGTAHPELFAFSTWAQVCAHVENDPSAGDLAALVRLIERHGPGRIIQLVDQLAGEDHADVVISTAHKSKGREWGTVRIAADFREPRPDDEGRVQLDAGECMLAYVAVTRAQRVLDRDGLAWVDRHARRPVATTTATAPEPERPYVEPCGWLDIANHTPPTDPPYQPGDRVLHPDHGLCWVDRVEPAEALPGWMVRIREAPEDEDPYQMAWVHALALIPDPETPPPPPPPAPAPHCCRCGSARCLCGAAERRRWLALSTATTAQAVEDAVRAYAGALAGAS